MAWITPRSNAQSTRRCRTGCHTIFCKAASKRVKQATSISQHPVSHEIDATDCSGGMNPPAPIAPQPHSTSCQNSPSDRITFWLVLQASRTNGRVSVVSTFFIGTPPPSRLAQQRQVIRRRNRQKAIVATPSTLLVNIRPWHPSRTQLQIYGVPLEPQRRLPAI